MAKIGHRKKIMTAVQTSQLKEPVLTKKPVSHHVIVVLPVTLHVIIITFVILMNSFCEKITCINISL